MIVPLVLSPSVFNFEYLSEEQNKNKLLQLKLIFSLNCNKIVYIFDKKNFIWSDIKNNYDKLSSDETKLFLRHLIKKIEQNKKYFNIENNSENDLDQICNIFVDLVKNNNDSYGLYADNSECSSLNCDMCISQYDLNSQCTNIKKYSGNMLEQIINKNSYIINGDYDINKFKNEIILPVMKYSSKIKIYDKQFGNLNDLCNDLQDNYKQNVLYWARYFFSINPLLEVEICTFCKDRSNKSLLEDKLNELENQIKNNNSEINIKLSLTEENIHERYWCTNLILFSCDRGLDLIDSSGCLRKDIHINIIDPDEAIKIVQNLNWNL